MAFLQQYLKAYRGLGVMALVCVAFAQIVNLVDPLIFGKVIDCFALHPGSRAESELVRRALLWMGIAAGFALGGPDCRCE
jgi:ATP-binding cassette, subfamily B, bacterial